MACNIILNNMNSIRTTNFSPKSDYNIEDINFYIPTIKSNGYQIFLVLKNNKNLYEIIELIKMKEGSSANNILYKVPLKQFLRVNNEPVTLSLMLINNYTGEYIYSSSLVVNILTDNFRLAQQVFVAQQVNRQVQDLYLKTVNLVNKIENLYNQKKGEEV